MTIRPFFRWYDLWVGAYIDPENKRVYICPLPMIGVCVQWGDKYRRRQTPTTGLGAIIGKWPGDETDEQIAEALVRPFGTSPAPATARAPKPTSVAHVPKATREGLAGAGAR